MKKMFTMLMIAMMGLAFTSCETDERIAYTLEGTWKGNMYISSYYDGRTYDATYSEITFLKDPRNYSSGSGTWVDYYSNAPWDYVANHIDWTVRAGTIYVHFLEDGDDIEIRNYHLDYDRFWGTIYDASNTVDFELYNTARVYYGSDYRWGYDTWYDYYGYRAYSRGATADSTTIEKPKRFVNPELKK